MNLVLDDAEEVNVKKKSKKALGMVFSPPCLLLFFFYISMTMLSEMPFLCPFREDSSQGRQYYINDERVSETNLPFLSISVHQLTSFPFLFLGENDDHPAEHIIEIKFSLSLYGAIAFTTTFCLELYLSTF